MELIKALLINIESFLYVDLAKERLSVAAEAKRQEFCIKIKNLKREDSLGVFGGSILEADDKRESGKLSTSLIRNEEPGTLECALLYSQLSFSTKDDSLQQNPKLSDLPHLSTILITPSEEEETPCDFSKRSGSNDKTTSHPSHCPNFQSDSPIPFDLPSPPCRPSTENDESLMNFGLAVKPVPKFQSLAASHIPLDLPTLLYQPSSKEESPYESSISLGLTSKTISHCENWNNYSRLSDSQLAFYPPAPLHRFLSECPYESSKSSAVVGKPVSNSSMLPNLPLLCDSLPPLATPLYLYSAAKEEESPYESSISLGLDVKTDCRYSGCQNLPPTSESPIPLDLPIPLHPHAAAECPYESSKVLDFTNKSVSYSSTLSNFPPICDSPPPLDLPTPLRPPLNKKTSLNLNLVGAAVDQSLTSHTSLSPNLQSHNVRKLIDERCAYESSKENCLADRAVPRSATWCGLQPLSDSPTPTDLPTPPLRILPQQDFYFESSKNLSDKVFLRNASCPSTAAQHYTPQPQRCAENQMLLPADGSKLQEPLELPTKAVSSRRFSMTSPLEHAHCNLSGPLSYRTKGLKWQPLAWCMLSGPRLIGHKSLHSMNPSLSLFLAGYRAIYVERDSGANHVIKIVCLVGERDNHVLSAESEAQARAWVDHINLAANGNQNHLFKLSHVIGNSITIGEALGDVQEDSGIYTPHSSSSESSSGDGVISKISGIATNASTLPSSAVIPHKNVDRCPGLPPFEIYSSHQRSASTGGILSNVRRKVESLSNSAKRKATRRYVPSCTIADLPITKDSILAGRASVRLLDNHDGWCDWWCQLRPKELTLFRLKSGAMERCICLSDLSLGLLSDDKKHPGALRFSSILMSQDVLHFYVVDKIEMGRWIKSYIQALGIVPPRQYESVVDWIPVEDYQQVMAFRNQEKQKNVEKEGVYDEVCSPTPASHSRVHKRHSMALPPLPYSKDADDENDSYLQSRHYFIYDRLLSTPVRVDAADGMKSTSQLKRSDTISSSHSDPSGTLPRKKSQSSASLCCKSLSECTGHAHRLSSQNFNFDDVHLDRRFSNTSEEQLSSEHSSGSMNNELRHTPPNQDYARRLSLTSLELCPYDLKLYRSKGDEDLTNKSVFDVDEAK